MTRARVDWICAAAVRKAITDNSDLSLCNPEECPSARNPDAVRDHIARKVWSLTLSWRRLRHLCDVLGKSRTVYLMNISHRLTSPQDCWWKESTHKGVN